GEVGAGARLGEALTPPHVEIGDRRQMTPFLLFRAESDDYRPDHRHAKAERLRRRGQLPFLLEDVLLTRLPTEAAPFDRPVGDRPAFLVEGTLPSNDVVFGEVLSFDQLGADAFGQIGAEERPHFVTKRELFWGKAEIHDATPLN